MEHVVRLSEHVKKALTAGLTTVATFFDIKPAFDTVWHAKLLDKMQALGITGRNVSVRADVPGLQTDGGKSGPRQVPDPHPGHGSPSGQCHHACAVQSHAARVSAAQASECPCMLTTWPFGEKSLPRAAGRHGWQNIKSASTGSRDT